MENAEMSLKIEIIQGDITAAQCEAIVNAANSHLWMGSGVAGAIKRKGGEEIEREAMAQGPVKVGEAVATSAGRLPFKYIIHAASMGQDLRTDKDIVYRVTVNSLLLADHLGLKSLAFPAIGTGVGGLSLSECADAMFGAVHDCAVKVTILEKVAFVLFDREAYLAFSSRLQAD